MDIGVAYYLEPHAPMGSSAWVSINGGPVSLKEHPASDHSIVWVTNVELSAFIEWDISQPNFKRNDFISGGLMSLLADLGATASGVRKRGEAIELACEIVARSIRLIKTKGLYADIKDLQKLGDAGKKFVVVDAIQERIEQQHAAMCLDAYKTEFLNSSSGLYGSLRRLSVHFPRGIYAKHMATRPLPNGELEALTFNKATPALQVIQELLPSHTGFVKLKAAKSRIKSLELLTFIEHSGQWFALPEAYEIAKQLQVKIETIIISANQCYPLRELVERVSGGMRVPLITTTLGLILHSSWEFLASQRLMRADNSHAFPSSQSAYLRAWDRMSCLKAARALQKEGALITGYGHGSVQMLIPQKDVSKFLIHAYEQGMTAGLSSFGKDPSVENTFKKTKVLM